MGIYSEENHKAHLERTRKQYRVKKSFSHRYTELEYTHASVDIMRTPQTRTAERMIQFVSGDYMSWHDLMAYSHLVDGINGIPVEQGEATAARVNNTIVEFWRKYGIIE